MKRKIKIIDGVETAHKQFVELASPPCTLRSVVSRGSTLDWKNYLTLMNSMGIYLSAIAGSYNDLFPNHS